MSNLFKSNSNSRFAALMDDEPLIKKVREPVKDQPIFKERARDNNSFTSNRPVNRDTCFRPYDEKEMLKQQQEKQLIKDFKDKEMERRTIKALNIDNFPDLLGNYKKEKDDIHIETATNYMEQIKKAKLVINNNANIDLDLVNLNAGWVMIKRDLKTGLNIIKGHPQIFLPEKSRHNEIIDALNVYVVQLHDKRTQEYIDLYGYDTWYHLFKGQDYHDDLDDDDLDDDDDDLDDDDDE